MRLQKKRDCCRGAVLAASGAGFWMALCSPEADSAQGHNKHSGRKNIVPVFNENAYVKVQGRDFRARPFG